MWAFSLEYGIVFQPLHEQKKVKVYTHFCLLQYSEHHNPSETWDAKVHTNQYIGFAAISSSKQILFTQQCSCYYYKCTTREIYLWRLEVYYRSP